VQADAAGLGVELVGLLDYMFQGLPVFGQRFGQREVQAYLPRAIGALDAPAGQ
jgi:hypothetical protein